MNTLFETTTSSEILHRIQLLSPTSSRRWGKMNVAQMMAHCTESIDVALGARTMKRIFIGRFIGQIVKKKVLNEQPMDINMPTCKEMIMTGEKDFHAERERLMAVIKAFVANGKEGKTADKHPFFGRMSKQEWDINVSKHLDHHLRQFGV